jgi:hypothetical protein
MKSGNLNFLEPFGPIQACNGTALPFTYVQMQQIKKMLTTGYTELPVLRVDADTIGNRGI